MTNEEKLNLYTVRIAALPAADGGGYKATYDELGAAASGYGEDQASALTSLAESATALVEILSTEGEALPEPNATPEWESATGRVTLRLPKYLHAQLGMISQSQGVSLNSLLQTLLAANAAQIASGIMPATAAQPQAAVNISAMAEKTLASVMGSARALLDIVTLNTRFEHSPSSAEWLEEVRPSREPARAMPSEWVNLQGAH